MQTPLAPHQSQLASARPRRHRSLFIAGGLLGPLALASAIAVSSTSPDRAQPTQTVVEQLSLQSARTLETGDTSFLREERIQRSDSIGSLLTRLGIIDVEATNFLRTDGNTQALQRQLAPGKTVSAQTTTNGELQRLTFPLNSKDLALIVERQGNRLRAHEEPLRFENKTVMRSVQIRTSLFAATDAAEIPDAIATQLADIFGGEIDFHRDLRKDDRFSVVYEMQTLRGQPARSGRVLAAEYRSGSKNLLQAFWFESGSGKGGYYNAEGRSLRKTFLRSPLEFSRVTSGFSMRLHPILQDWRAHKGIDYGAPAGTRVRTTGDGVVEFAGHQGGYGNLLIIRHAGTYSTAYGHLRGFAPGLKKGSRISQGDTIGYVGQTGWATGPHLHYEFRISNQQVNPLAVVLPPNPPLEAAQLQHFGETSRQALKALELLQEVHLARID